MTRPVYWLLHCLVVGSLLLCLLTLVLWVRSYSVCDFAVLQVPVNTSRSFQSWAVTSNRGLFVFGWQDGYSVTTRGIEYKTLPSFEWTGFANLINRMGFAYDAKSDVIVAGTLCSYWKLII